jgi:dienelactone hydrolase
MKPMLLIFFAVALNLGAQVPKEDVRPKAAEGTKYAYGMPQYSSLDQWNARKDRLRKQILAAAGLLPLPERGAVRGEVFRRIERRGYSVESVYLETLPGYYLCGNLYRPLGRTGPFPGIVSPHGHWRNGRLENTDLASVPGRAINLARQGYVVFTYDMIGYADTKQTDHRFGGDREHLYNFHPLGLQLWNSIRALDFVASLPDVDPQRLGATGASGGGTQTFLLFAVDDRVKAAVPVNMISGTMQGGSICENAPGLRHDTFNVDFGAMMAPRPMLLISATGDWTKAVPAVEFPAIRQVYDLYDARAKLESVQFDSPHNYHKQSREAMYTFFARTLLGASGEEVKEEPFTVEPAEDLLVWYKRTLPANARNVEGIFDEWRELTRVRRPEREPLRYALSVETPQKVFREGGGGRVVLHGGKGDRVLGRWEEGKGDPLVVVHAEGAEAARSAAPAGGRPALYVDVWQTGSARAPRDTSANHFYTFHRTDAQNRVQDILTALAWVAPRTGGTVELRCPGEAGIWCLFAAAVFEGKLKLRGEVTGFGGADEEFLKRFFVPGIQRVGGIKTALALTAPYRE